MGIWQKIKELVRRMLPKKSIEKVLHVTPCVSDRMAEAIQLWSDMYEGKSPWLKEGNYDEPERVVSLGLPALIASEKARMATLEMKTKISAPTLKTTDNAATNTVVSNEDGQTKPAIGANTDVAASYAYATDESEETRGPSERADFLNSQYKKLIHNIRRQLEYGIAKGGLVIKPYIVTYDTVNNTQSVTLENAEISTKNDTATNTATTQNNAKNSATNRLTYSKELPTAEIEFDFIQADRFFPLAFDANGKVVEAAFVQTQVNKAQEKVYIRLEYHKLENRTVTVQNLAFESTDMGLANANNIRSASNLGSPIPLSQVPEWSSLQATTVIENVDRLLFAYFKMPEANTIDPYSPLGVSGYSRATSLIKDADEQYSRLLWEYEGGELAVDVDRDALKFVTDTANGGHSVLPKKQSRLFRKVDLNAEDTYNVFAPALRDTSIINGLNTILTKIEDVTGLSRGTLSEVNEMMARTATELKILKQRSYATNADIQIALQSALEDAVYVMDVYSTLYEVTPDGEYEVSFEWDDSILVDNESELSKRISLMQNGLASKIETRMWYFGETENQAKRALQQVSMEATQAVLQNVQAEQMAQGAQPSADGDTTSAKKSTGQQADSLDNPNKSPTVDDIKGQE